MSPEYVWAKFAEVARGVRLARVITEQRQRWELLALGAAIQGVAPGLRPELFSGVRRLAFLNIKEPDKAPSAAQSAAFRASLLFGLEKDRAPGAVIFLEVTEQAESVVALLCELHLAVMELQRAYRALADARIASRGARSEPAESPLPRVLRAREADVTASPGSTGSAEENGQSPGRKPSQGPVEKTSSNQRPTPKGNRK